MTYDCQLIEDLLPAYLDGTLSPTSRELVEAHLGSCEGCQAMLAFLEKEQSRSLEARQGYERSVTSWSQRLKKHRRLIKLLVGTGLVLTTLLGSALTLLVLTSPFGYVAADLGDYGRSSKQIEAYLDQGKLPSFLPRQAEDIALIFEDKGDLINGKFHLSAQAAEAVKGQLQVASVADLVATAEVIPGYFNGVKETLEESPAGASYFQDTAFVYVFMTDGTIYYYSK